MTEPAAATARSRVVDPRGRSKAFRPLPATAREAALDRGLAAYARGEFYLAHEELEPAWMGTDDPGERELLSGLIKLAAGFVHAARGNPAGARTNLIGARQRLAVAATLDAGNGFDLPLLLAEVDARLVRLATLPGVPAETVADPPHDVAGPPGRAHRPPLDLDPPAIPRRNAS